MVRSEDHKEPIKTVPRYCQSEPDLRKALFSGSHHWSESPALFHMQFSFLYLDDKLTDCGA